MGGWNIEYKKIGVFVGIVSDNLRNIREQIKLACEKSGRNAQSVRLVAVSKTKPASAVLSALAEGQDLFGENRVQEARDKIPLVADGSDTQGRDVQWHLIGPLQRNKVKIAVKLFSMVHSVDSVSLAQELSKRASTIRPLPILIQVNVGGEKQKNGLPPGDVIEAVHQMANFDGIKIKGLMTVPPVTQDPQGARPFFKELATLAATIKGLQISGVEMTELSMGMSHDYIVAVEEGATLVRVGSALFGSRL
ncbi:MAG: YggS family pyridoxal phosphate-dependent enzyme [Magnetococcales bacterium]|nr:YggS family pyridoxal phosphate-dependent enzyme [Magnetococcales bacterium]